MSAMLQDFSVLGSSVVSTSVEGIAVLIMAFALGVAEKPVREIVRRWLAVRRRVSSVAKRAGPTAAPRAVSVDVREGLDEALENLARDPIRGPRIYVSAIDIKDFRCFEDVTVKFHHPGDASQLRHQNVNLILGDNGSGKSTLLKAIAIAALGPILDSSGFYPYHLVRSGHRRAMIGGSFVVDDPASGPTELDGAVEIGRVGDLEKLSPTHSHAAWSEIFD